MIEELAGSDAARATRRVLLRGAGAVGATTVLAACGTDSDSDSGSGSGSDAASGDTGGGTTGSTGGGSPQPSGGAGAKLAAATDIPVGGGTIFAGQGVVVTQPTAGTFKGFSALCTHANCTLSRIEGGVIKCGCHGSTFSIEDGSVTKGPATKPLAEKTITKDGDTIVLG